MPKIKQTKKEKGIQKTIELTSSPYNTELEEAAQKRTARIPKMEVEKQGKERSKKTVKKVIKEVQRKEKMSQKRKRESSDSSIEEITFDGDSDSDLEDTDDYCAICKGYYYDKKGPRLIESNALDVTNGFMTTVAIIRTFVRNV